MTLQDRCLAYAAAFPDRPRLQVVREQDREVIYGTWLGGQNYRQTSALYGAYPHGYLERVLALFPDVLSRQDAATQLLHVFSGSLSAGPYLRCDIQHEAEYSCSVYDLPGRATGRQWSLLLADPPYSADDARRYGTKPIDRRRVLAALAAVTSPGGHLVYLDCVWPMHSKRDWRTIARITLIRSTNHRVRLISIFERAAA